MKHTLTLHGCPNMLGYEDLAALLKGRDGLS